MLDDTPTAAVEKSPNPHRGRPGLKSRKPEPYLADDLDQEGKLDFHAGPPCKTSDAHNDPDDDAEFFLVRGSDQSDDELEESPAGGSGGIPGLRGVASPFYQIGM